MKNASAFRKSRANVMGELYPLWIFLRGASLPYFREFAFGKQKIPFDFPLEFLRNSYFMKFAIANRKSRDVMNRKSRDVKNRISDDVKNGLSKDVMNRLSKAVKNRKSKASQLRGD